jgi:hypothetical protein
MGDLLIKAPIEYELLRKNRFILRFPSDLGIQEWWVSSVGRPSYSSNKTEIPFINTKNYVIGQYSWEEISLTLKDPIGPSASQAVMEWVRLHSESISGRQGYAVAYKRDLVLQMLDPNGVVVSQWILKEAMIVSAKFSELSYDGDDLATVDLTLQPFYCILSY